jgi:regulator of cell morphogenesis and NO signaling
MFLQTTIIDRNFPVSDIVKSDFRTADVFRKYGIEYCCGGKWPLAIACEMKGADFSAVYEDLEKAIRNVHVPATTDFSNWSINFLTDYIVNIHHEYLKKALPQLLDYIIRFAEGHRKKFAYLDEAQQIVNQLIRYMMPHLQQEEEVIFPYIRRIAHAYSSKESYASLLVRTLRKPVEDIMHHEHAMVLKSILRLRTLTDNYTTPENSCISHKVTFHKMKEVDNDLAQHMHLENEILFPKAIAMEKELLHMP